MRQRLKNRRACESFDFEVAGQHFTVTVGRYADGTIGEIFLQSHKPGSQSDAWRLLLADLVAFSHLQFSQIRGRQPDLNVRKTLYVIRCTAWRSPGLRPRSRGCGNSAGVTVARSR